MMGAAKLCPCCEDKVRSCPSNVFKQQLVQRNQREN